MTILEKVAEAVALIVDSDGRAPSFYHGRGDFQNVESDFSVFPVVYLGAPLESTDFIRGGAIIEQYELIIAFLDMMDINASQEEQRVAIDKMRDLRARFLGKFANSPLSVISITTSEVMNVFDVNASGVILTMIIEKPFENASGGAGYC